MIGSVFTGFLIGSVFTGFMIGSVFTRFAVYEILWQSVKIYVLRGKKGEDYQRTI